MSNPVIQVEHLTRRFGELTALDDVGFTIQKGEVVGILGVNGAGKSTAMRILTGYLPATSGIALVGGFDVLRQSLKVRERIGYLPENVPLYREHRVVEMLAFQAALHRVPRRERKSRIDDVLAKVGLTDRKRQIIGTLSRGLRQRVGLAVALLPNPEVLILDEPTSGLDPLQRIEVRTLIRSLAQSHTVLLSSHILPEIEAVCPRVIILHKGRIAADGSRADLVRAQSADRVHVEAVVGADVEGAARLLRALPGVREVVVGPRSGIHQAFEIAGEGDLREDVGALAAARKWALRELSRREATLEDLFARIALGEGEWRANRSAAAAGATPPNAESSSASNASDFVELALPSRSASDSASDAARKAAPSTAQHAAPDAAPNTGAVRAGATEPAVAPAPPTEVKPVDPAPAPRRMYNLNPFENRPRAAPPQEQPRDAGGEAAP